jgi:hypothetical protein
VDVAWWVRRGTSKGSPRLEHDAFFFPLAVAYMGYGVLRQVFLGFLADDI